MMADPAIESAQRAWRTWDDDVDEKLAIAAAREMAKPIRELHVRVVDLWRADGLPVCNHCDRIWPCRTARLIYTTEELAQ